MELSVNKIKSNVQQLVLLIREEPSEILTVLLNFLKKKDYGSSDILCLLKYLSRALLDEKLTISIATAFEDCLLLLITDALEDNEFVNDNEYIHKCIALAKLMNVSLCAKRYAMTYFLNKPPPFSTSEYETLSKKLKTGLNETPDKLAVVKCCYYLLKSDPSFFKELWNWSDFFVNYVDYCNNEKTILNVYINHIIAMLTNMNASAVHRLNEKIPQELIIEFSEDQESLKLLNLPRVLESDIMLSKDNIPIFNRENYELFSKGEHHDKPIIRVESARKNLRSIALGVTSGRAICLSGPVGCGKTTLVEYLAHKTGRIPLKNKDFKNERNMGVDNFLSTGVVEVSKKNISSKRKILPNDDKVSAPCNGFLRVQLGDQTDSKLLLGQYHCTDVPGEFIWLPGVLTQAVMNGYWLLLEDLDCATTDTFTVLNNLLEDNYLSVPGFRDCVKVAPGFQLFVTALVFKNSKLINGHGFYDDPGYQNIFQYIVFFSLPSRN